MDGRRWWFEVTPDGTATTIAGTGVAGFSGDGGSGHGRAVERSQRESRLGPAIYDGEYLTSPIRATTAFAEWVRDGTISTIRRGPVFHCESELPAQPARSPATADPAVSAQLCEPAQLRVRFCGRPVRSDYGNRRIRRIATDGNIVTIAGNGQSDPNASKSRIEAAMAGPLIHPTFYGVGWNRIRRGRGIRRERIRGQAVIRKISASVGIGQHVCWEPAETGYSGDGGLGDPSDANAIPDLWRFDPKGNLFVITGDSRVRKISPGRHHFLGRWNGDRQRHQSRARRRRPGRRLRLSTNPEKSRSIRKAIFTSPTHPMRGCARSIRAALLRPSQVRGVSARDYYNAIAVDPQGNVSAGLDARGPYPLVTTAAVVGTVWTG